MEEPLKKRLIGLAVILFAGFLLTFLLPRRPPPNPSAVSIPVTAVAVSGASVAAPPASVPVAPTPPSPPSTAVTGRSAMSPLAAPPAPSRGTPSSGSAWYVQIGSYSQRAGAERVLQRLGTLRLAGEVQAADVDGKTFYRVRLGPYADAVTAARAQRRARDAGFASTRLISP